MTQVKNRDARMPDPRATNTGIHYEKAIIGMTGDVFDTAKIVCLKPCFTIRVQMQNKQKTAGLRMEYITVLAQDQTLLFEGFFHTG